LKQEEDDVSKASGRKRGRPIKMVTIGEVMDLVMSWRALCKNKELDYYSGSYRDALGNQTDWSKNLMTTKEAADHIGISYSAITNYDFYIKSGLKGGFNFKDNWTLSLEILRKFVKESRGYKTTQKKEDEPLIDITQFPLFF
jgi:hypothetical protein